MKTVYHDSISIHTLKRLKKQLCRIKIQEEIVFVHGTGRRKTQLQKSLEQLDRYLEKLKEYTKKTVYAWGQKQLFQNRSRCHLHENERGRDAERTVKACV